MMPRRSLSRVLIEVAGALLVMAIAIHLLVAAVAPLLPFVAVGLLVAVGLRLLIGWRQRW